MKLNAVKCNRCGRVHSTTSGCDVNRITTERELKDRCTPDIIKRMVELAEGFEIVDKYYINFGKDVTTPIIHIFTSPIFPLLIHRAAEGFNKQNEPAGKCGIYSDREKIVLCNFKLNKNQQYKFKGYILQSLTQDECACLHCMLDIFEEVKK